MSTPEKLDASRFDPTERISDELTAAPADILRSPNGRRRKRDVGALLGAIWVVTIVVAAAAASILPIPGYDAIGSEYSLPPFSSLGHMLGTDQLGRDQLSRALYGARISLSVGLGATLLALVVGTTIGVLAGYYRGAVDKVTGIGTDVVLAFPPLILLIALVAVMESSVWTLVLGLGLVGMPTFARIARANTIAFTHREFVIAAGAMGASDFRILLRELLPNVLLPVVSFATVVAAGLVVAEGSLSFLGLGVPPPTPSWGGMIAAGRSTLYETPFLVLVPGAFFFLTVFSLNRIGDWARSNIGRESAL
ncbi:ABC transporter permease [Rhodococcus sp. P1Y]|uniref:ABC transporter permease n=1 Tax=Rhodococcus sp. P1Y TaxID=1302308 RepID=UPI000EAE35AA|nr:ABC transporter permease [Rhodococcus sp. P1Y]AYJ48311.1 ABC transporter permease [Rhodococcus sp. P1Y]